MRPLLAYAAPAEFHRTDSWRNARATAITYGAVVDEDPVTCRRCQRSAARPPPTWSLESEAGQRSWLCENCTRDNLRSIEAKLEDAWW